MINKISINGFQAYNKEVTIELSNKVTAIIGPTDSGKSSIIRAISKLLLNRPLTADYLNWNSKFYEINITTDKGNVLYHYSRDTYYKVNNSDTRTYRGFGRTVPDFTDVLNLNKSNIQNQLDPHFLILNSPGDIAREINYLGKLDVISNVIKSYKSKIQESRVLVNQYSKDLEITKESIKNLSNVVELSSLYDKATILKDKLIDLKNKINSIITLQEKINSLLTSIKLKGNKYIILSKINTIDFNKLELSKNNLDIITTLNKQITEINNNINNKTNLLNKYNNLNSFSIKSIEETLTELTSLIVLKNSIISTNNKITNKTNILNKYNNLDNFSIKSIEEISSKLTSLIGLGNSIVSTNNKISEKQDIFNKQEVILNNIKDKFINTMKELKLCPYCYNEITEDTLHKITEAL